MKPPRPRPGLLFLELQAESVDWDPPFNRAWSACIKKLVSKSNEEKDMKNLRGKEIETYVVAFLKTFINTFHS
jgi:hypothetical protein